MHADDVGAPVGVVAGLVIHADAAATEEWVVDESEGATCVHNEGFAHFIWIENAADFDGATGDGEADYEGTVETCDMLDIVFSATAYGGAKNLEPQLLLGIDAATDSHVSRPARAGDLHGPVHGDDGRGTVLLPQLLVATSRTHATMDG